MNSRTKLYQDDIVEMPSMDRGHVILARVVTPGPVTTVVELLDGEDPADPDAVGPYRGDQLLEDTAALTLVGPAQGRGLVQ